MDGYILVMDGYILVLNLPSKTSLPKKVLMSYFPIILLSYKSSPLQWLYLLLYFWPNSDFSISSEQVRMFWGLFFWIFSASQFWNMHQPLKLSVNRDHLDCLCTFLEGLIIKCHFRHPALDEALGMWKSCTKCSRSKVMITINEIYKLPDIAWLIE